MTAAAIPLPLLAQRAAAFHDANFEAIAFDGFPVFDPRPLAVLCETLFPGKGGDLVAMWRTRQFEYAWLRALSNRYADFERVTDESLAFAAKSLGLEISADKRALLLQAHFQLKAWPDAIPALAKLKEAGMRLALLSNLTQRMLNGCMKTSGVGALFEQSLSTDAPRTYKPDARAYRLGVDAFGLPREKILFVASAGWDAAGAKSFGYRTFWVNRLGAPPEELDLFPDGVGANLADLLAFVG